MATAKKKNKRKALVFSIIGLTLIALSTAAFYTKRDVVVTIQTEKAQRRNITEIVVANGRIQPVVQVVINPEVSGEIISLPVVEGQKVKKGDLLVKIKPDNYVAARNSIAASFESGVAGQRLAKANLEKAKLEFERFKQLHENRLVSDSQFLEAKTALAVMEATFDTSTHQMEQAKASLAKADDDLAKTTIFSPIDGSVTKLRSQLGERVVGTALMAGTEIMTIANLESMEARVDIGEIDVVLIALGQHAKLEVDAFHDQKFTGTVTEIANASKGPAGSAQMSSQSQEATKFEVKIRINEKEMFRPGMSVTAEIETRSRTNVLSVPIQSVTTRMPNKKGDNKGKKEAEVKQDAPPRVEGRPSKQNDAPKALEVVFMLEGDHAKMAKVKSGISDDSYIEVLEGLKEGDEVVSGGYKAINRELEDGKKVKKGPPPGADKEKKP